LGFLYTCVCFVCFTLGRYICMYFISHKTHTHKLAHSYIHTYIHTKPTPHQVKRIAYYYSPQDVSLGQFLVGACSFNVYVHVCIYVCICVFVCVFVYMCIYVSIIFVGGMAAAFIRIHTIPCPSTIHPGQAPASTPRCAARTASASGRCWSTPCPSPTRVSE
jgi:hypothetical protein